MRGAPPERSLSIPDAGAGWHRIPFSGVDDGGRPLARGVYFYRVTANGTTASHKLVIAR